MSNKIQFLVKISVEYGHMKYTRRTKYQIRNAAIMLELVCPPLCGALKSFMHESATILCTKVKIGNRIPSFAENGGVVSIDLYMVQN